ncbi:hypothetical protein C9J01_08170 [Photobacterium rosenbergii]|uniref:Uncharacterized protein n=1 Tax=Photobacterium rosenbergii TaxID=294936 RepID=A0A2T3NHA5_9GAMM|nr:hypothetical protein C9J01_08170 [Photobacterium rosenbergii]
MCFDGLGLKALKEQIKQNAENAASQNLGKAVVRENQCTSHKAKQGVVWEKKPSSKGEECS